jgi:hypothetical protein
VNGHLPRFRLWLTRTLGSTIISLLIIVFCGITIIGLLQSNAELLKEVIPSWIFKLKLMGIESSAGLLAALIGLKISIGSEKNKHNPILVYQGRYASNTVLDLQLEGVCWGVILQNNGSGEAKNFKQHIVWSWQGEVFNHEKPVDAFMEDCRKRDWNLGSDFNILNISSSYVFPINTQLYLFKIHKSKLAELSKLEVHLTFENIHGERFKKVVHCQPKV